MTIHVFVVVTCFYLLYILFQPIITCCHLLPFTVTIQLPFVLWCQTNQAQRCMTEPSATAPAPPAQHALPALATKPAQPAAVTRALHPAGWRWVTSMNKYILFYYYLIFPLVYALKYDLQKCKSNYIQKEY